MRVFTAHIHPRKPPALVPEAFSWGAFLVGPLWLLRHGAWIGGAVALAVLVLIATLPPPPLRPLLGFGLFLLLGLLGHDLLRWSLALGRYQLAHIVAAPGRDAAFLRLLAARPDLIGRSQ